MSKIFVVSAPSGTGKTTLNRRLLKENPGIEMSVSYTARPKRENERDGVDYHFISKEEFQKHIEAGDMLEYAEVFGVYYGTSKKEIERIQKLGKDVLLEIDVQGWDQAKSKLEATSIFILPPSLESLHSRLEIRATEAPATRYKRLMTAKNEIGKGHLYEFFVVNDEVEPAYRQLYDIVIGNKTGEIGHFAGAKMCEELIKQFENAPWLEKLSKEIADV
jgi:guanylate kinase